MDNIKYILCHGSGNRFVMFDAISEDLRQYMNSDFVQKVCHNIACDGVLFATQSEHISHFGEPPLYQMRMFNTDGSEAEMCGNGIRCVARLVRSRYLKEDEFEMISGQGTYHIKREKDLAEGVSSFSVSIGIGTHSDDFTLSDSRFVGKRIEALDTELYFTYLNLGNPHIVTLCDQIDLERLERLGERVKTLRPIFPNGVNVSMIKYVAPQKIFVATFERGVGLTPSCGTAMTASCTASVMLGVCRSGVEVEVQNRGGLVYCTTSIFGNIFTTTLKGNATFDSHGEVSPHGEVLSSEVNEYERNAWSNFLESLSLEKIEK